MTSYDDVCNDPHLYAGWLTETHQHGQLAQLVTGILRDGGYAVTEGFSCGLGRLEASDLANFQAHNFPFDADDRQWLAHCANTYPREPHPSESDAERNGPRTSWRNSP